ncbi:DUF429 domain-containing protein [Mycobacterium sp. PSTR-4-N]|uniref:DUF429 domain-containing protein n=1 Tax=Mycobacterium sp. PSTR-4-N TaxID=2917745 RepID=UPI0027E1C4CA|nr:DUF429 domain-containing protein [Mycobacterium sp. PSTR-4-N]
MHFIGLDLAWGENNTTGVAVLDSEGRLVHLGSAGGDPSILAQLARWVDGPCLVAIDAPLIVKNAVGNRPCEKELNKDFYAFDAGALPANMEREEFRGVPRGTRIAEALGLDIDPHSKSLRRALEVYPHPATVALFRLDRTLKYKHKKNRSFDSLQSELMRLIELLESRVNADVGMLLVENAEWSRLHLQVENATTKAELRRAEDPVDAVVCAYVALYATARPEDVTVYGDIHTGYILTPTKPADLQPSPRSTTATDAAGLLNSMRIAATKLKTAETALQQSVDRFRQAGGSWEQVGAAVGIDAEVAEQRFT